MFTLYSHYTDNIFMRWKSKYDDLNFSLLELNKKLKHKVQF